MIDVSTEIDINCSRKKVAEYSANSDNAPKWYVNIKAAKWKTPKPLQVGSQIVFKARFMGKALVYIYEIAEYAAEQKMVMKTIMGPFPMETIYTWKSIDGNITRMSLQNKGNPGGLSKLFTPLFSLAIKNANNKEATERDHQKTVHSKCLISASCFLL
jgi:polyketide cyclase/dehydrase/lipid transport protein